MPMRTRTHRMDDETVRNLARIAEHRGKTPSETLRDLINAAAKRLP